MAIVASLVEVPPFDVVTVAVFWTLALVDDEVWLKTCTPVGPARVEAHRRARDRLRADRADGYAATHAALPVDDLAEIGRRGKGVGHLHVVQRELSGVRDGQNEADVLKG